MASPMRDSHLYSVYFAPRGKARMINLGWMLSQRHLSPFDLLIGFIGEPGSGKSSLVRGMFPGLELASDDEGVNVRPLPLLNRDGRGFRDSHTYHLDVRFEMAFTQVYDLAQAVRTAVEEGKRVVVEHFELLYPYLGINAQVLVGVGEEVILTRPTIFGPEPQDVANIVFSSSCYRKMAHTAENLTELCITKAGYPTDYHHGDVHHGFILEYDQHPGFSIPEIEAAVKEIIAADLPVAYKDEGHVYIGEHIHPCTGPRLHVKSTGEIENFSLMPQFQYDPIQHQYLLVGLIGERQRDNIRDLNRIVF